HRHHRQPHTHHNSSSVSPTTPPHFPKPPCCGVIRAYHTPKMVRNPLPRGIPPKTHTYRGTFRANQAYHTSPMSKQGEPWGFLVRKKFLNRRSEERRVGKECRAGC